MLIDYEAPWPQSQFGWFRVQKNCLPQTKIDPQLLSHEAHRIVSVQTELSRHCFWFSDHPHLSHWTSVYTCPRSCFIFKFSYLLKCCSPTQVDIKCGVYCVCTFVCCRSVVLKRRRLAVCMRMLPAWSNCLRLKEANLLKTEVRTYKVYWCTVICRMLIIELITRISNWIQWLVSDWAGGIHIWWGVGFFPWSHRIVPP